MALEPAPIAARRSAGARPAAPPPQRAGMGYSRFVMLMKITLPLIAAVLVALIVVWPQFRQVREGFRIEIARLNHTLGGQVVSNARFTGADVRGRPFSVTADSANQQDGQPNTVLLEHPKADITMQNGAWVASSAPSGKFLRNEQLLELTGGVNIYHDNGFEMHSPTASLDLKRGTAEGKEPVQGQGPTGDITASGFRVLDNGARVFFTGPAKMTLRPEGTAARR
jgi:lipopolysaccharide export system protein LptC